jgi:hypothetical protein
MKEGNKMIAPRSGRNWKILELTLLTTGLAGSAVACLANYNWHWFRESVFYMIWSAAPFLMLGVGSHIVDRILRSPVLHPIMTLLAFLLAFLSLTAYIPAVLHPHHSSGMIFAVLPLCWMIGIPAVLTFVTVCFLVAESWRRRG